MNFLFLETLGYESPLRISGHHYARLLVERGHGVASLSTPVTPFHKFARKGREAIARRFEGRRRGFAPAPGGAHHYVPMAWLPLRRAFPLGTPAALRLAAATWRGDVMRRLARLQFAPDVVSIQNLAFYPLLREFPGALVHYRMTDIMAAFPDIPPAIPFYEEKILNEADLVSLSSMSFEHRLAGGNERKLVPAPNAVDAPHFREPQPRPEAYRAADGPIVIYIGSLRFRMDWDLLRRVVGDCRDVTFFIISPDDAVPPDLQAEPNLTWIPGAPYEEIPAWYQHADVGILPFRTDLELVAPGNSLKMYECLAAGTPVVCTDWPELRRIGAPVGIGADAAAFAAAMRERIGKPPPPETAVFLGEHSWAKNLDVLLDRIAELRPMVLSDTARSG